jgi:hypothetical protein
VERFWHGRKRRRDDDHDDRLFVIKLHLGRAHKFTRAGPYAKGMHRPAGFPLIHAAPYVLIDRLPGANAPAEPSDKFGVFSCQVGIDVLQAKRGQPDNTVD